mmetsp:Transcript_3764/g.5931  ORF Transcript_3764/g.5931 Transcript_3764/m.5931 type:complete len:639 (-) Transcript_3764:1995-3911(-)
METRGNILVEGVPQPDPKVQERITAYQNTRNCSFKGFLQDDGLLIGTRFANSAQIHHVKFPMGARKQITFFDEPVKSCNPSPRGCSHKGFIHGGDKGGDEKIQFSFYDMATGKSHMFTDGKSMHQAAVWSEDACKIAYSGNQRNGTNFDVYITDFSAVFSSDPTAQAKRVYTAEEPGYHWTSSFVGSQLLVRKYVGIKNSTYMLLDCEGGDPIKIAPQGSEEAAVACGDIYKSNGVIYASNEGTNFMTLRFYDFKTFKSRELVPESQIPWDIEDILIDDKSDLIVVGYNVDGCSTLYFGKLSAVLEESQLALTPVNTGLNGVLGKVELDSNDQGCRLGYAIITAESAMDVYVKNFSDGVFSEAVRWTEAEVGGLNPETFIPSSLIHYKSFDGLEIGAFVYRPKKEGKVPVIIHPHGGPEGQHRPMFSPTIQFLVCELGICVIDPNVRGSDGYGKVFVDLDTGKLREDSVKDIGALLDWIDGDAGLDSSRIGVWGGSYGGYMVLASLVHYSDRLCCGIDMVGISNFVTFLENTADYRRDLRRVKYGDERDPSMREFLMNVSPLTHAHKISKPLFIVQGANDPRVPLSEAEQIRDKVRNNQVDVWYMVAKDEGHGFAKKANVDQYQLALVAFWQKHLLSS